MDKAIERINVNLAGFRRELAESEEIVQTQQASISRLTTQIDTLSKLRAELEGLYSTSNACVGDLSVHDNDNGDGRLPPSEAILKLLTDQPGLLALEVIEALEHRVQSTAQNLSHNLRTTLFNLEKRGTLVRDEQKRYRLAESSDE